MNTKSLFSIALNLQSPWNIREVFFSDSNPDEKELHLYIGFTPDSKFFDGDNRDKSYPVHDTVNRQWQHLSFFEHTCYVHCAVPRIEITKGETRTIEVPWARTGSAFTLLFTDRMWNGNTFSL